MTDRKDGAILQHIEKPAINPNGFPDSHGDVSELQDRCEELHRLLNNLCQQIQINDFRDGLGHDAKMLQAYHEAMEALW